MTCHFPRPVIGLVFASLLLLPVTFASAQRLERPRDLELEEDKPYVHEPTGMKFPVAVGDFKRRRGSQYDQKAHNVSVSYGIERFKLFLTAYAYPAGEDTLADHMKHVQNDLTNFYPDAKLEKEGDWKLKQGDAKYTGRQATYTHEMEFLGEQQPVVQRVYLLKLGEHFIKFRVTYPAKFREKADKAVETFLRDMKLPAPPKEPTA